MLKNANALLADLNFKESDFAILNGKFGHFFSEKRIYNPKADYHLVLFNKRKLPINSVFHFYCWDTHFKKIEPVAFSQYIKTFPKVKAMVQTDFSAWYFQNEERREAIKKNFINMKTMTNNNFKVCINFNNIHGDLFEEYKKTLPKKVGTVFYDFNHNEDIYIKQITKNFKWFIDNFDVSNFIFITSKSKIPTLYFDIFQSLKNKNIPYQFLPTEMRVVQEKRKRGIIK